MMKYYVIKFSGLDESNNVPVFIMDVETTQWLQELRSFLDTLLERIIPDRTIRANLLTPDAMKVWSDCFTHETFSPSDNYEDHEYIGDADLKAVFPRYLRKRLPHLHKNEYTELYVQYMSKMRQAQLARMLGLDKFVRVKGINRVILNLGTDVFESFFGGLDAVSEMAYPGSGMNNCYNMIVSIFSTIKIDEKLSMGSAITQVEQIFVRFELPKPIIIINEKDHYPNIEASVKLTKPLLDFLAEYGVTTVPETIGHSISPTKKEAKTEAFRMALETLTKARITTSWAKEAKLDRDLAIPEVKENVPAAKARLKQEGFVGMNFVVPRKTTTTTGAVVQLVGVRPNGKLELLAFTYTPDRSGSYATAKAEIVRNYAQGKKM